MSRSVWTAWSLLPPPTTPPFFLFFSGAAGGQFKGLQIVARKTLDGDRVELKVKMDGDPPMSGVEDRPPFMIQTMVNVGNEWRVGGVVRDYQPEWDNDGQIQPFAQ